MSQVIAQMGEANLIKRIKQRAFTKQGVCLGIGDDAAVLDPKKKSLQVLSTDTLVEKVDFSFRFLTAVQVGRKALAVNLSDLAAMGAKPEAVLVSLVMPRQTKLSRFDDFLRGFSQLAKQYRVSMLGGDLSQGPCWIVTATILGSVKKTQKMMRRSGARVGHLIAVTGKLGGTLKRKHFAFEPRIKEGQFLARNGARSMIDISDGLCRDLGQMVQASRVSAEVDVRQIPVSRDARLLSKGNRDRALRHALTDGEDFELLFTVRPSQWKKLKALWRRKFRTPLTVIGRIKSGKANVAWHNQGQPYRLGSQKGYDHFQ